MRDKIETYNTPAVGYSIPPIIPFINEVTIKEVEIDSKLKNKILEGVDTSNMLWQEPVKFRLDAESEDAAFLFPLDPIIGIQGRNIIKRRYVSKSKMRGSIKECWSQDDYEINISGVLINKDSSISEKLRRELRKYCEAKEAIHITNNILNNVFEIHRIAIESFDFPFTKGTENQSFSIKAYSDDLYTLLEENNV